MRIYSANVLLRGDHIGQKLAKAWLMKPKQRAGNSSTTQGRSSDARVAAKTQKIPAVEPKGGQKKQGRR
jgi:hypothetical protein